MCSYVSRIIFLKSSVGHLAPSQQRPSRDLMWIDVNLYIKKRLLDSNPWVAVPCVRPWTCLLGCIFNVFWMPFEMGCFHPQHPKKNATKKIIPAFNQKIASKLAVQFPRVSQNKTLQLSNCQGHRVSQFCIQTSICKLNDIPVYPWFSTPNMFPEFPHYSSTLRSYFSLLTSETTVEFRWMTWQPLRRLVNSRKIAYLQICIYYYIIYNIYIYIYSD